MIIHLWYIFCHTCGKTTPHTGHRECLDCMRREGTHKQAVALVDKALSQFNKKAVGHDPA